MNDNKNKGKQENSNPIKSKQEVDKNPDPAIDKDFPGYPHAPSQENMITPKNKQEEKNADLREAESDGSANAFESTEDSEVLREELDKDQDNKEKNNY